MEVRGANMDAFKLEAFGDNDVFEKKAKTVELVELEHHSGRGHFGVLTFAGIPQNFNLLEGISKKANIRKQLQMPGGRYLGRINKAFLFYSR